MNLTGPNMTLQPITGLGSKAMPACYALANQRLGSNPIPTCNVFKTPIEESAKAQKDEEAEGRGFSGFLA